MRLTNDIRDRIKNEALNDRFKAELKELDVAKKLIGDRIYKTLFKKNILELLITSPKYLFRYLSGFYIDIDNSKTYINLTTGMPFPHEPGEYSVQEIYKSTDKNIAEYLKAEEAIKDLNTEQRSVRDKLHQLLFNCSNTKKLEEMWPEGKKYYSKYDDQPVTALVPANLVRDINTKLGIQ